MKFAVTQTSSSWTIASSGWPACTTWPVLMLFFETTPRTGALTVVYCRLSSACASVARACATCASAAAARALVAATCDGPVCAVAMSARACSSPARDCASLLSATRMPASASSDLRPRRVDGGLLRLRRGAGVASNICCETSSLASRPRSRSTSRADLVALASASRSRACALTSRARAASISFSAAATPLCAWVDAAARGRHVAGGGRRGDRDVALRRHGGGFGVGQLGARLVDRDLVVARIELDQHRAGLDQLVVVDRDLGHRAADARGNLRHVRINLRIVGRFAARRGPRPQARAESEQDDDADDDPNA